MMQDCNYFADTRDNEPLTVSVVLRRDEEYRITLSQYATEIELKASMVDDLLDFRASL